MPEVHFGPFFLNQGLRPLGSTTMNRPVQTRTQRVVWGLGGNLPATRLCVWFKPKFNIARCLGLVPFQAIARAMRFRDTSRSEGGERCAALAPRSPTLQRLVRPGPIVMAQQTP